MKHYNTYRNSLIRLCNSFNLKLIKSNNLPCEGIYIPSKNKIKIEDDLDPEVEIATILHELGHFMDDMTTHNLSGVYTFYAYDAIYRNRATKKQKAEVIRCEKIAWDNGRIIAKQLKIRLGKWYDIEEKSALKSYRAA